jgi:hypothetical protein
MLLLPGILSPCCLSRPLTVVTANLCVKGCFCGFFFCWMHMVCGRLSIFEIRQHLKPVTAGRTTQARLHLLRVSATLIAHNSSVLPNTLYNAFSTAFFAGALLAADWS